MQLNDVYKCENVIQHYATEENVKLYQLLLKKWSMLKELVIVLQIPYKVTIAFQNEKLTLSDLYGKWLGMELHLDACSKKTSFKSDLAKYLLNAAKNRNISIFDNPLMMSALYLDPRFHYSIVRNEEKKCSAKETLKIWRRLIVLHESTSTPIGNVSNNSDQLNFSFDEERALVAYLNNDEQRDHSNQVTHDSDDIELLIDLFQPKAANLNANPVQWWESMKTTHPQLYDLAATIFSIPPTEVKIERDFSHLDFIFTKRRGNLCQKRLEDIFIIHLNSDLFYAVNEEDVAD